MDEKVKEIPQNDNQPGRVTSKEVGGSIEKVKEILENANQPGRKYLKGDKKGGGGELNEKVKEMELFGTER